ncbi:hypothetical protein C2I18_28950 [Paenibacillus sp. PK3_47]|uniref:ABC transporter ATP-binding protein n=1 Tax=Paenibacillus sp. PK3_47 TaxID=2072642 RepID=UPI00201DFE0E|nr:ABC transporter ATP-binding protein [Paenibacillus sp. PK3_47]UQZ37214.1 hypothetical protein C2I18_28950 [Paenibacillus sp. PK3_47]
MRLEKTGEDMMSSGVTAAPVIELSQITKRYNRQPVLQEFSLTVNPGMAVALIGRNGSGKSTLLSILAGLIKPTSGRRLCSRPGLVIGYAPEAFPSLKFTPVQYLRSMGEIGGMASNLLEQRVTELLEAFQLSPYRDTSMYNFSKGMLQKVNLIQSLIRKPQLLLLDEPMSGLDLPSQQTLLEILLELKQGGTAMVFSVHEPLCVEALADSVHVLQHGRTVMKITDRGKLRDKPSTYIVFTSGRWDTDEITAMPGFISLEECIDDSGAKCTGLSVESASSDVYLRYLLDTGSSIISVEPSSGLNRLRQWMDPVKAREGGYT